MAILTDQDVKTLNLAQGPVSTTQAEAGGYLAVGTLIQTAQTDIAALADETAALGAVPVVAIGYAGTRTVAQINGLSPSAADCYVVSNSGTLTTGSLAVTAGDLVEYSGSAWVLLSDAVDGFVPACSVLVGGGTLYAPLTDGTDEYAVATFSGRSNTPTLVTPAEGDLKRVVAAADGSSVAVDRIYLYSTSSGWITSTSATLSSATPQPLGVAAAGSVGTASDAGHVHAHGDQSAIVTALHDSTQCAYTDTTHNKIPAADNDAQVAIQALNNAMPFDSAQYKAAAADRAPSDNVENTFATTYTLPANALAAGSAWTVSADCLVAGVSGTTPGLVLKLKLDGNAAATATFAPALSGDRAHLQWTVKCGVAGASGVAVIDQKSIGSTGAGAGTGTILESTLFNAAFDTTATHAVTVTAQWDETDAANLVDLRFLNSSYRLAAAVT